MKDDAKTQIAKMVEAVKVAGTLPQAMQDEGTRACAVLGNDGAFLFGQMVGALIRANVDVELLITGIRSVLAEVKAKEKGGMS